MKYIQPKKLKIIMIMFFATGIWGILYAHFVPPHPLLITIFGTINFCLGGVFTYRLLTQEKPSSDDGKKKRRNH
jgi:hypothetical protein